MSIIVRWLENRRDEGATVWAVTSANLSMFDAAGQKFDSEYERPSLAQVFKLFDQLKDSNGGDLWINGQPGDRHCMVAGGPTSFLVSCIGDAYGAHNLVDPPLRDRKDWMTLVAGGLPSSVEVKATVSSEMAILAIRYFYSHGAIDPELVWE